MAGNRRLLRVPQAVDYLSGVVPAKTLREWIWQKRIKVVRLGRIVTIPVEELDRIIRAGTTPARKQNSPQMRSKVGARGR